MHKILDKLKEEFFAILPPTIFFFVMLHIVAIIRVLMTKARTSSLYLPRRLPSVP